MYTEFHLKTSELNINFFERLLLLLGEDLNADITISYKSDKPLVRQKETRQQYKVNLISAIENIEKNRNLVSFSGEEFRALTKKLLKK